MDLIAKLSRLITKPASAKSAPVMEEPFEDLDGVDVDSIAEILRQAQGGDCAPLFALYREIIASHSHLQNCLAVRKDGLLKLPCAIRSGSMKDATDKRAADYIAARFPNTPGWETACAHLLDSVLYPVAVVEKRFRPATRSGAGAYELAGLIPVPHQLLELRDGAVRIRRVNELGLPTAVSDPCDPARYIVHRAHTLSVPDTWGGPMRSLVFWWLLSISNRESWARLLERSGASLLLGHYPGGQDEVRQALERAMQTDSVLGGAVIPVEADLDVMEARALNGRVSRRSGAMPTFHAVANAEISKLILGHDGAVETSHASVRVKRCGDMRRLGDTLRHQLFAQMLTFAGLPGRAPFIGWDDSADSQNMEFSQALARLKSAGLRVATDGLPTLSSRYGVPVERDMPHTV